MYDDPNGSDSVVVREGSTQRVRYPNLLAAIREHPGATRTSPPPDENPAWYIGDGGQWRKDPVGRWGWKRGPTTSPFYRRPRRRLSTRSSAPLNSPAARLLAVVGDEAVPCVRGRTAGFLGPFAVSSGPKTFAQERREAWRMVETG